MMSRMAIFYWALVGCLWFIFAEASVPEVNSSPAQQNITQYVYMDISIEDKNPDEKTGQLKPPIKGRLILGLFGEVTPRTVHNFVTLIKGDMDDPTRPGKKMAYKGTKIHRIVPNFVVQGGDFTRENGTGGRSIYGETFEDENFIVKHEKHVLSMANKGRHTNGSQFFITLTKTEWLDGRHVVFGRLIEGADVLQQMESYAGIYEKLTEEEKRKKNAPIIKIDDCGVFK